MQVHMEGAAEAASISRTTAYRYSPNLRALLVAAYPHFEEGTLLGPEPPRDPVARLEIVALAQTRRILTYEREMWAVTEAVARGRAIRSASDAPGLRIGWIEDGLALPHDKLPEGRAHAARLWHRCDARRRSVRLVDGHRPAPARGGRRNHAFERLGTAWICPQQRRRACLTAT